MAAKVYAWPERLPVRASHVAADLGTIVTALENYRPAVLKLSELPKDDPARRYAEAELRNLRYELLIHEGAFGIVPRKCK